VDTLQGRGAMPAARGRGGGVSATVAVAVCTYHRPTELARLLEHIAAIANADQDGAVPVVVVDDSREGDAWDVVAAARAGGQPARYEWNGAGDIAAARNRALEVAREEATFVACVDDDCVPQPGWLAALLGVADRFDADVVVGHRQFVPTDRSPRWLREQPFLRENELYADGVVPPSGNTANVLLRSGWLRGAGVRFAPELGRLGGEDMVFLADAARAGANIRFAADALVLEPVDERRSRYSYQLWRQLWLGNNEAHINRHTGRHPMWRLLARGCRQMLRGAAWPLRCRTAGRGAQLRWAVALVANGMGLVLGVLGAELPHRS
jgi:succinoglycan biosynthesis protein ExoM